MKIGDLIYDSDYGMMGVVVWMSLGGAGSVAAILYEDASTHETATNWPGIEVINENR